MEFGRERGDIIIIIILSFMHYYCRFVSPSVHTLCLGLREGFIGNLLNYDWECGDCKLCHICHEPKDDVSAPRDVVDLVRDGMIRKEGREDGKREEDLR
jgi:hypothetical protein